MRVLFLTLYPETMPSSRLRVYQYLPFLAAHGVEARCLPAVPEPWFSRLYFSKHRFAKLIYFVWEAVSVFLRVRQLQRYDVIFVQKGILSTDLRGFEKRLVQSAKRIIYDFDDDVLGRSIVEFRSPGLCALQDAAQTLKLAAAADTVIAGNEYLRQKIAVSNPQTVVLPTPVDTDRFRPAAVRNPQAKELVIGWIGMEGGLVYLLSLAPVLQELARRYSVRLKVISHVPNGKTFEILGIKTQFVRWNYESEVREMEEFDIGIMPVPQDEWGQGKCGLKLLQYMAMEIASVATRVGVNCEIVKEGVDACLALSHAEWIEKLSRLIKSPHRRQTMGQAARRKVIDHYSLKTLAPRFVELIKGTVPIRGQSPEPKGNSPQNRKGTVPMRIIYILPQMDIGGSETHVVRLAEGLCRRGHDVKILCVFEEGRLAPWILEKKVPLEVLHAKRWGLSVMGQIGQRLWKNPADIVHTYLFGLHLFAGFPARWTDPCAVISSRRGLELSMPWKLLCLEKMGNFFADYVVANSEVVRKWTIQREKLKAEKIITLYNGVDITEFSPGAGRETIRREFNISEGIPLIGTVANFSEPKGYPYLIETAGKILQTRPDCRFLFVGFGPMEADMRSAAARLAHGENILFAGMRRDIPRLLSAMDFFVLASLWEGMPNVVLEAMAMAKPVVSTPAGGVPEVITDGVNGRLVPFRDPQAMAEAILELLNQPEKAAELGRAARRKIETDFTLEHMIDQYENFYRGLINRNLPPPLSSPACEDGIVKIPRACRNRWGFDKQGRSQRMASSERI